MEKYIPEIPQEINEELYDEDILKLLGRTVEETTILEVSAEPLSSFDDISNLANSSNSNQCQQSAQSQQSYSSFSSQQCTRCSHGCHDPR